MKIPKRIEKLIERRERLANELGIVDIDLTEWLEKNGIAESLDPSDFCGGVEMYSNPADSAERIREAILKK
jgi:hypothetical protein